MIKILFSIRAKAYTLGVCLLLFVATACKNKEEVKPKITTIDEFYLSNLTETIAAFDSLININSIEEKQKKFQNARKFFKYNEALLAFVDKNNYKTINAPNILSVQEEDATDIKIKEPIGFQVIEKNLFQQKVDIFELHKLVKKTNSRLKFIQKNSYLNLNETHILYLLKDEIVRIGTMGITGFDSPVLEQSLQETKWAYEGIEMILSLYQNKFTSKKLYQKWMQEIKSSILATKSDFKNFNRYHFLQNHTHKQLQLLVETQKDWKVEFPFELALKNDATSLFSNTTFNLHFFEDYKNDTLFLKEKIALGKKLFHDKKLSLNNNFSCATCHIKKLAFTDGKKTFDNNQIRNTPTLAYAALQQAFFYDGRAGSLEGQIIGVVNNHNEFATTLEGLTKVVLNNNEYKAEFDRLYVRKGTDDDIRQAIASYIRTLNTFESKFDKNINKKENSLTTKEIKGFNLFMGKAKCATCHFPPLFNGTVPPNFKESELELIGTPKNSDFKTAVIDTDLGRYNLFQTEAKKHFFKTPTLRNISKTAPYMHNGVYTTLEEVLEFYNRGGGNGLNFNLKYQTLPSDSLNLTKEEIKNIIAFLKTLND